MNKHILLLFILVCMGFAETQNIWAFDRYAKPTFIATWTPDKTAPEYKALPKDNPTLSYRAHHLNDTSELRFYENTCEVALYSPGTRQFFVIPAANVQKAYELWQHIAIRYTYYIAEDRTYDLFPNSKDGKIDPKDKKTANKDEIRAGELFLYYLHRVDGNLGYGTGEVNNKYNLDQLTVVYTYDGFLQYIQEYDANDVKRLMNLANPFIHKYLDNNNLEGMKKRISEIYSSETVWNNWYFSLL